jgi:hypothetical protein
MQCQRCQFENMPGQARCFKCGSILEGEAGVLDVQPPRMASWKRPWRGVSRLMRRHSTVDSVESKIPTKWVADNAEIIWGIILSIVPGFAHLLKRRFRSILWVWLLWLVFFGINALLFRTPWGWRSLGVAAAMHAWIALDIGLRAQLNEVLERVFALLILFVFFLLFYVVLAHVCLPGIEFRRTPLAIPGADVRSGDTLLLRILAEGPNTLARGSLVGFHALGNATRGSSGALGQIVGLPNELVVIDQGVYTVNGTTLSADDYPVPAWLPRRRVELLVGPNQYFVSSMYSSRYGGRGMRGVRKDMIKRLCLVNKEAIASRVTMLWWPLNRRHRLITPD